MTIRNLHFFFQPRSVAVIGATSRPGSVGSVLVRNLITAGLEAPVYPVNPKRNHVHALPAYPNIASLPEVPDLAVIATPPDTVPGIVAELGARGCKACIVITAGFSEGGREQGKALQQAMLEAARPHLLRIIGPNCLGIMVPHVGLNASFGNLHPLPGRLAFVTQSGAVATAVVDWAKTRGIGFSHLVSLGGMADVDFGDMLDYLALDRRARAILLYVEAITHARKFMSAARAAARAKPVIVVKAGRFPEGARAAASHTGALAGSDAVYDAAFRRAGVLRVYTLDELFDASETLSRIEVPKDDALAILTNGGGAGVLASDAVVAQGGRLAELAPATLEALDAVLPATWSHGNPVDIIGDAPAERYRASLDALLADPGVDAVLVLNCPTAIASGTDAARAVIDTVKAHPSRTVLTNWLGGATAEPARRLFAEAGLPTYATPSDAVQAFMHLVRFRRRQAALMETPASIPSEFVPDTARARALIQAVIADGRELLTEIEAKEVLEAYGIAAPRSRVAGDAEEARACAAELTGPYVLKILSRDISHKSDVGGVALGLRSADEVAEAARAMLIRVHEAQPAARIDGLVVQEMVVRPNSHELILGIKEDAQFGPTVLFGQGGTAVEVIADTTLELPPLNLNLARAMMRRTRVYKLLQGYRDRPPADLDGIALTLMKLSQLATEIGEVKEVDINPLLADAGGVMALDARIRVLPYAGRPQRRLVIEPYPKELEEEVKLADGRVLLLRPIRGEDEPALRAAFAKLTPEEVRLRFMVPMKTLDHMMAARLTQINYDREMALVLTDPGPPGTTEIYGVVRLSADPDNENAEYAIIVRGDMKGRGLGYHMMQRILAYARSRGIGRVFGTVLRENTVMLRMCEELGFRVSPEPDDPGVVRVEIDLRAPSAGGGAPGAG